MQITIDTDKPLNETEKSMLQVLLGVTATHSAAIVKRATPEKVETPPETAPPSEQATDTAMLTLDKAVSTATQAIANGKTADVKAALARAGAKRVSELTPDKIKDFVEALA